MDLPGIESPFSTPQLLAEDNLQTLLHSQSEPDVDLLLEKGAERARLHDLQSAGKLQEVDEKHSTLNIAREILLDCARGILNLSYSILSNKRQNVKEEMKRREFVNLSTQALLCSCVRPPSIYANQSTLSPSKNIVLHYLDHYVLPLTGYQRLSSATQEEIRRECHLATRLAILFTDQVFVPAVSYYQSSICREVIDSYREIYNTGIIKIIADAYSLEEFQYNRLREYRPGSEAFNLYQKILEDSALQPSLYSCVENTTIVLNQEWEKLIKKTDIEAHFLKKVHREIIPRDFKKRLAFLTEKLNYQAFIVENIYPHLFQEEAKEVSKILKNELLKMIDEMFFNWFTQKLNSGVVEDLVYLNQLSLESYGFSFHYKKIKTELMRDHHTLFQEIINAKPQELISLKKNSVLQKII